jgi:hypothetical protein
MSSLQSILANELNGGWRIMECKTGELLGTPITTVFATLETREVHGGMAGKWMFLIKNSDGEEELNFVGPELYRKLNSCLIAFKDCWETTTEDDNGI